MHILLIHVVELRILALEHREQVVLNRLCALLVLLPHVILEADELGLVALDFLLELVFRVLAHSAGYAPANPNIRAIILAGISILKGR